MARIKYYYDTESCRYERIRVSSWDIIWNALGFLTLALILAGGIVFIYTVYFESPEEALLRKENDELKLHYELLNKELATNNEMLNVLTERDDYIYRVIFGVDQIPEDIRKSSILTGNDLGLLGSIEAFPTQEEINARRIRILEQIIDKLDKEIKVPRRKQKLSYALSTDYKDKK